MRGSHKLFITLCAVTAFACGKISTKNQRSASSEAPASAPEEVQAPQDSDDAIVGANEPSAKSDDPAAKQAVVLTGKELYSKMCASCHGAFEESEVAKDPMAKVRNAIFSVPDMANLKDSSEKDIEAIVTALGELSPGKGKDKKLAEKN